MLEPSVPDDEEGDPDCDHARGSQEPPNWDPPAPIFNPAPAFLGSSALGVDPDVQGTSKPVVLRYGTVDATSPWGGWKILAKLPNRNANGKRRGRRVVAQLAHNPDDVGEFSEKGIITSFGFASP